MQNSRTQLFKRDFNILCFLVHKQTLVHASEQTQERNVAFLEERGIQN